MTMIDVHWGNGILAPNTYFAILFIYHFRISFINFLSLHSISPARSSALRFRGNFMLNLFLDFSVYKMETRNTTCSRTHLLKTFLNWYLLKEKQSSPRNTRTFRKRTRDDYMRLQTIRLLFLVPCVPACMCVWLLRYVDWECWCCS